MARARIKRKSTFIDMTAMSDVTVLLLTFFMLTSTFVKKEPVQVATPSSVSEIKIPETNVLQILVEPSGKVFLSLDKQPDMKAVLDRMGEEYGIDFTPEQEHKFMTASTFGVPMNRMSNFLNLSSCLFSIMPTASNINATSSNPSALASFANLSYISVHS